MTREQSNRFFEYENLIKKQQKHVNNCRKYGLIDEYITSLADLEQLKINFAEFVNCINNAD